MINEQYVSSEVVRLLKEKGFKYAGFRYIDFEGEVIEQTIPTQQTVMRWLREVHHIHVCPEYKAFFQERPKKVYHHWCNKIVGIGRCFKHGIQDLDKLDSDYFSEEYKFLYTNEYVVFPFAGKYGAFVITYEDDWVNAHSIIFDSYSEYYRIELNDKILYLDIYFSIPLLNYLL